MQITIRKTRTDGVIQITTLDERWYAKTLKETVDKKTVERTIYNPAITWIAKYSPMGVGLLKHYARLGWDEATLLRDEAGERGSRIHQACDILLQGGSVKFEDKFIDPDDPENEKLMRPLTPDEYSVVMTFADWWEDFLLTHDVQVVDTEKTVWFDFPEEEGKPRRYGYAATRDFKLIVDGKPAAFDIKTGQHIYLPYEIQLSAIKHADPDDPDIFILQIGYKMNKRGWKLTPVEDDFGAVQAAMYYWRKANPDSKPKQKDYPPVITLLPPDVAARNRIEAIKKATPIKKIEKKDTDDDEHA